MVEKPIMVLIAEDEDDLREMYVMSLSSRNLNVLAAANGKEVFERLDKNYQEIKLLILDIVMPEMDGFEVLKKLRKDERYRKIPVIVSTNLDNEDDREEAMKMGALEYFVKSQHTPSQLTELVLEKLG